MTTRGATLAALLAALGSPSWWVLALASFLVRGGIVVFVVAIVTLPSPLALSNVLGPIITPLYLGQLEPRTVLLIVSGIGCAGLWLVVGGWFAGATEVALIQEAGQAARDEGLVTRRAGRAAWGLAGRAAAAHLVALIPLALVLGLGSVPIFGIAYRELVNPSDTGPLIVRIVAGARAPLAAIVVAWILGEIVGGMAVRRIVIEGASVGGAVLRSTLDLVRRPAGGLVAPLATTVVLVIDLAAVLTVVMIVWTIVRNRLVRPLDDPMATGLGLVTLGATWCLALLVTGLIDAWRSATMTFEAHRRAVIEVGRSIDNHDGWSQASPSSSGTIGASAHGRPGEWSSDDPGGSL